MDRFATVRQAISRGAAARIMPLPCRFDGNDQPRNWRKLGQIEIGSCPADRKQRNPTGRHQREMRSPQKASDTRRVSCAEAQARAEGDSDLLLRGRSGRAPCHSVRCDRLTRRCCDGRGYGPTDEKTAILSEGDGVSGPGRAG